MPAPLPSPGCIRDCPAIVLEDGTPSAKPTDELFFISVVTLPGTKTVHARCTDYAEARREARRLFQAHGAVAIADLTDWSLP